MIKLKYEYEIPYSRLDQLKHFYSLYPKSNLIFTFSTMDQSHNISYSNLVIQQQFVANIFKLNFLRNMADLKFFRDKIERLQPQHHWCLHFADFFQNLIIVEIIIAPCVCWSRIRPSPWCWAFLTSLA